LSNDFSAASAPLSSPSSVAVSGERRRFCCMKSSSSEFNFAAAGLSGWAPIALVESRLAAPTPATSWRRSIMSKSETKEG